jgi:hypothetical protein
VEAYKDAGGNLMSALENTTEYARGAAESEVEQEVREEIQNERSLEQLQNMMKGLGR